MAHMLINMFHFSKTTLEMNQRVNSLAIVMMSKKNENEIVMSQVYFLRRRIGVRREEGV